MASYDEEGLKNRLIRIGERIFGISRNELYLSMRFFDLALGTLDIKLDLTTGTLGTDGVSCFYNPRYLMDLYQEDRINVNRAYLHMLLHCIFGHMYLECPYDAEYFDLACDIAVESVIDSMNYSAIRVTVRDEREELYRELRQNMKVLTAEGIARYFQMKRPGLEELEQLSGEFRRDDHDFFRRKRKSEPNEDDRNKTGQNGENQDQKQEKESRDRQKEQWEKIGRKTAMKLASFDRQAGKDSGSLSALLRVQNRETVDYRSFLRRFSVVREENRLDPDHFDFTYYTYGLSYYGNMPLIEPLEQRETEKIEEFVIVLDTSGSCSGRLIREFLKQTWAILKETDRFFRKRMVHIIQCDMEVRSDTVITEEGQIDAYMDAFCIKGLGGTDFRPAFSYVNRLIGQGELKNLKGLLYFTDGFGTYPVKRPGYDTAFLFLDGDYEDRDVPGWALKVVLEPEAFEAEEI